MPFLKRTSHITSDFTKARLSPAVPSKGLWIFFQKSYSLKHKVYWGFVYFCVIKTFLSHFTFVIMNFCCYKFGNFRPLDLLRSVSHSRSPWIVMYKRKFQPRERLHKIVARLQPMASSCWNCSRARCAVTCY